MNSTAMDPIYSLEVREAALAVGKYFRISPITAGRSEVRMKYSPTGKYFAFHQTVRILPNSFTRHHSPRRLASSVSSHWSPGSLSPSPHTESPRWWGAPCSGPQTPSSRWVCPTPTTPVTRSSSAGPRPSTVSW